VALVVLQRHSWAPTPSNGYMVNVGTTLVVPLPVSGQLAGGKARRRLTPSGWDGGRVVVRGGKAGDLAKGSSVIAASEWGKEVAGEHRRFVARPR
jgi:hypothetical protein